MQRYQHWSLYKESCLFVPITQPSADLLKVIMCKLYFLEKKDARHSVRQKQEKKLAN